MATKWTEKKSGDFNPIINVKEKVGQITEGVYNGARKIEKDGDTSTIHTISMKGAEVDFWGTGKLNALLEGVEAGTEIRIEYLGKVNAKIEIKGKKVNKEIHDFKLYTA